MATSSGQNKQSQNMTFFGITCPGKNLSKSVPGVRFPLNNGISCWVSGLKAVSLFPRQPWMQFLQVLMQKQNLAQRQHNFRLAHCLHYGGSQKAACQCSRLLGSSGWLKLWGASIPFLGTSSLVRNKDRSLCCCVAGQCSPLSRINSGDQSRGEPRLIFRISEGLSSNLVWVYQRLLYLTFEFCSLGGSYSLCTNFTFYSCGQHNEILRVAN